MSRLLLINRPLNPGEIWKRVLLLIEGDHKVHLSFDLGENGRVFTRRQATLTRSPAKVRMWSAGGWRVQVDEVDNLTLPLRPFVVLEVPNLGCFELLSREVERTWGTPDVLCSRLVGPGYDAHILNPNLFGDIEEVWAKEEDDESVPDANKPRFFAVEQLFK